jgi:pilus assembly protein CpaB
MNRDTRMWIVIAIAVGTAALATYVMYKALPKPPAETPKVFLVAAKKPLERGATVTDADVKMLAWPKENQIAGAFTDMGEVRDRALVASIVENEPLTESKLAKKGDSGLSPIIPHGFRAISVKVNEVIGVAGFVTPGTLVDVLVTIRQDQDAISRIVVQNVEVLTAGAKYDDLEARREGKPIPSTVVTLMVKPDQAERIALAASQGQIMLTLRNPQDTEHAETYGITTKELTARATTPVKPPPPGDGHVHPPPPPPRPCQVETFKAGKREVVPCA